MYDYVKAQDLTQHRLSVDPDLVTTDPSMSGWMQWHRFLFNAAFGTKRVGDLGVDLGRGRRNALCHFPEGVLMPADWSRGSVAF